MTQQIRESMAASVKALVLLNTLPRYNVYSVRRDNLTDEQLPAVVITIADGFYENGAEETSVNVRVEIRDTGKKIENILDDHAQNYIEPLFPIGNTLGGLVEYIKPVSFAYILDDDSGIGSMILNYNVKYENEE